MKVEVVKMELTKDEYLAIRKAQAQGARTIEDLQKMTDIVMDDDEKLKLVNDVLANACRCKNVLLEEIIVAVKNGRRINRSRNGLWTLSRYP